MKKLFFIISVWLVSIYGPLNAQDISLTEALLIAENFLYEQSIKTGSGQNLETIEPVHVYSFKENGTSYLYVFSNNIKGFCIISAFKCINPVIGYSMINKFPKNPEINSNYSNFLNSYVIDIKSILEKNPAIPSSVNNNWEKYQNPDFRNSLQTCAEARSIDALCYDKWNQDYPYNIMCPEDPDGPGNHVYAGCVATAMSQIMYYWRFPETGQGSHGYNSSYGYLNANFGQTNYDWTSMQNDIDPKNPWAIGLLQYHAGVSVDMNYSPNGSGAWGQDARDALVAYFKYPDAQYLNRDNYNLQQWTEMLQAELDNKRPVAYYGYSETAGHAFVCDGYDDTYFHFNFGWGGAGNGFYTLNDINGYHNWQQMIRYISPPESEYPNYINESVVLTNISGSITDGSGPVYDHATNISASWLIDPQTEEDSVENITLAFTEFELGENDVLTIYDGGNSQAARFGSYTGTNNPGTIISTGNELFVTFQTDDISNGSGFYAEYDSKLPDYCQGIVVFEEGSGTFSDGSGTFNYGSNQVCFYQIKATEGMDIILNFNYFETEPVNDFVKIYDNQTAIATFSGSDLPGTIIATSGSMLLAFKTDAFDNADGWEVTYETVLTGVNENISADYKIFPNPVGSLLNIEFSGNSTFRNVEIYDLTGNLMLISDIANNSDLKMNTKCLNNGLYFVKITGDQNTVLQKIIINH